jgi:hypothetical protein
MVLLLPYKNNNHFYYNSNLFCALSVGFPPCAAAAIFLQHHPQLLRNVTDRRVTGVLYEIAAIIEE